MMFDKAYQVIYADPPWKYGGSGGTKWSPASDYYPTMSFNELKRLPIKDAADKNSLLFLWVVNAELKRCIDVGESWGFKYVTVAFVWYKERANVGNYTMPQCELCLLFKRGKIPTDRVRNPGTKSFHSEKIRGHSQKLDEFRNRIMQMFPKSNKLELFARNVVPGWDAMGNALNGDPLITINEILHLSRTIL